VEKATEDTLGAAHLLSAPDASPTTEPYIATMLGYGLAFLIGLSLGVMGGGGSILTVPIFVYAMGFAPKQAIAMSLPVVGLTSLVAALGHWRAGNLDVRAALSFGIPAMIGARLSASLSAGVSGVVQLTMLGVVMLAAGVLMLRRRPEAAPPAAAHPAPVTPSPARRSAALTSLVGLGVGTLTGLIGIGGGFLFVPALVLLGGLPMKSAVGSSLLAIALSTAAASLGYRGQVTVPWTVVLIFTAIAIAGSLAGARTVRFVSPQALRRAFAYFLFVMAAFILFQNRGLLLGHAAPPSPSSRGAR
jgi:uncharacterized protein